MGAMRAAKQSSTMHSVKFFYYFYTSTCGKEEDYNTCRSVEGTFF